MSAYTQIAYPYFRKRQVLKNTDLNNMVDYLDQHNRFTRVLVVGSGIFSGLEVNLVFEEEITSIKVTQGFGLSSDGFIIQMKKDEPNVSFDYTYYRKLTLSENDFKCEGVNNGNGSNSVNVDVYELLEESEGSTDAADVLLLSSLAENLNTTKSFCLVLWVSKEEEDRPNCIDICDETGADLFFTIKPLLVPSQFFNNSSEIIEDKTIPISLNKPPQVKLHPFGYHKLDVNNPISGESGEINVINPALIQDFEDFKANYLSILSDVINNSITINEAYEWAYQHMQWLGLEGDQNPFDNLQARLTSLLDDFTTAAIHENGNVQYIELQYFYAYLHDLIKAYEEFAAMACSLETATLPLMCKHARHIRLAGIVVNVTEKTFEIIHPGCRTIFQPSLFYQGNNSQIQETEFYFTRMIKMASNLQKVDIPLTKADPVDISHVIVTPGRSTSLPLSKQTFPYYYKNDLKKCRVTQKRD